MYSILVYIVNAYTCLYRVEWSNGVRAVAEQGLPRVQLYLRPFYESDLSPSLFRDVSSLLELSAASLATSHFKIPPNLGNIARVPRISFSSGLLLFLHLLLLLLHLVDLTR